jgi:hypothetical protein
MTSASLDEARTLHSGTGEVRPTRRLRSAVAPAGRSPVLGVVALADVIG